MDSLMLWFLVLLVLALVLLNAYATLILMRTHFEVKNRRKYQVVFVWLVPLVGALMVVYIDSESYIGGGYKHQVGNKSSISRWEAVKQGWAETINSQR